MTQSDHATVDQLLQRAREGDKAALMQLLMKHHQPLLRFIRSNLGDKLSMSTSAEDILQDTFVSAMSSIRQQEKKGEAAFVSWLHAIAKNRIRDAARSAGSKKRGGDRKRVEFNADPGYRDSAAYLLDDLDKESKTPSRLAAQTEAIRAIQAAISNLPENQAEAIRLHYFDRKSLEETANVMNRTVASVRGLVQRAKRNLRTELDSESKWLSR